MELADLSSRLPVHRRSPYTSILFYFASAGACMCSCIEPREVKNSWCPALSLPLPQTPNTPSQSQRLELPSDSSFHTVASALYVCVFVFVRIQQCLPCGEARFLPFCLDKHFLSVNTGEPGTPWFPDMHEWALTFAHMHNINTIFALHAGSLSLTPVPSHVWITAGTVHTCFLSHTHTHTEQSKHAPSSLSPYVNCNTLLSTLPFPLPVPDCISLPSSCFFLLH